jgi:16S rRNA (cytidine1402-2'-O)-methyltransferase
MSKGKLYLIPNSLEDPKTSPIHIPEVQLEWVRDIKEFVVENEKNARACLKALQIHTPQNELILHVLDKHDKHQNISLFLKTAESGGNMGLLSDAGVPCVADPGSEIVALAHKKNIEVIPIVGASSILLAIMASGFNGQSFAFHGYLPIDKNERSKKLKQLERESKERKQTQLFIETPYRNNQLLEYIIKTCSPKTKLCIASNLTTEEEKIISQPLHLWQKQKHDFHKKPAVFVLYSN